METTFGRTVETRRLLNNRSSSVAANHELGKHHNFPQHNYNSTPNYNINEYLMNAAAKQLKKRPTLSEEQQQQHALYYQNLRNQYEIMKKRQKFPKTNLSVRYNNTSAQVDQLTPYKHQSIHTAPHSSVLTRKSYKYIPDNQHSVAPMAAGAGYSSDSECYPKYFKRALDLDERTSLIDRQRQLIEIENKKTNYKGLLDNSMLLNDENEASENFQPSSRSLCTNPKIFEYNSDLDNTAYSKSINRQSVATKRQLRPPLKESANENVLNEDNHLFKTMNNRTNINCFYPENKNGFLSPQLSARISKRAFNTTAPSTQPDSQPLPNIKRDAVYEYELSNNYNLGSYLTWKNFNFDVKNTPDQNNNSTVSKNKHNIKSSNQNNPSDDNDTDLEKENKVHKIRSISTPGTPMISHSSSLPRKQRCYPLEISAVQNRLKIVDNELNKVISKKAASLANQGKTKTHTANTDCNNYYDAASLKHKRIQSQLEQLEEIKRLQQLKLEFKNQQRSQSMSITQHRTNPCNNNNNQAVVDLNTNKNLNFVKKPENGVNSLENALQNMNEILKNLTMKNAQKKEIELAENNQKDFSIQQPKDISPPISTSTSLSFASSSNTTTNNTLSNVTASQQISIQETKIHQFIQPKNISPSSSISYSGSSSLLQDSSSDKKSPMSIIESKSLSSSSSACSSNSSSGISSLIDSNKLKETSLMRRRDKHQATMATTVAPSKGHSSMKSRNEQDKNCSDSSNVSFSKKIKRFLSLNSKRGGST